MTNIQAIAQLELDAYIEQQAQEVAPEPKIDFIDIDGFYNFEASVNSQVIAKIWINTSAKYSFWVVEVNDIEVHHCYLFADACDFVKAAYSNGSLHLLPQVTPPVEFTAS
jgi:hypothetical protein